MPRTTLPPHQTRFHLSVGDVELWVDDHRADEATADENTPHVVFIHGSWDDHRTWDRTRAHLPAELRHLAYDRRGHSASSDVPGQGTILQDVDDLLGLLDALGIERPQLVGHSYGGSIAIATATGHPDRVAGIAVHEPPVFALLSEYGDLADSARAHMARAAELIAAGEVEAGAIEFVEKVAFGPGAWRSLFDSDQRATMLTNAHTWLDQFHDPERLAIDIDALAGAGVPVTVSVGTATLPTFAAVARAIADRVPTADLIRIRDGAHGCPVSHPDALAAIVVEHLRRCGSLP